MIGRTISHYEITEKLGEGGMGVVYKAHDSRLKRFVALKVLPPEKVTDPDRKQRFVEEARSASALNHPNIVTVHDIDESGGVDFIAMEYVEGKTLNELIGRKGLKLNEALKYAIQIADALAKAHAAGIVHRDLKPGNVMVTAEGRVKVLDFGLAKLTETAPVGPKDSTLTEKPSTELGLIVGTASYMSPEQAEGKKVDARSDIFSFGSVLYEMLTGRRAFRRDSLVLTLAAILNLDPPPLPAEVPDDLKKVIVRCLRQDVSRRYQHMDDVKVALEELKEESESGAWQQRASTMSASAPALPAQRRWLWPAVAGVCLVIAAAALATSHLRRREPTAVQPPELTRLSPDDGHAYEESSISSDGKFVTYVSDRSGKLEIWLQQVGGAEPIQLTHDSGDVGSPQFTPDGTRILYQGSRPYRMIESIPTLGGQPRVLAQETGIISPDGRYLLYDYTDRADDTTRLMIRPLEGGAPRELPNWQGTRESQSVLYSPVGCWSADGRFVLVRGVKRPGASSAEWEWFALPVDGGAAIATGAGDLLRAAGFSSAHLLVMAGDRAFFGGTKGQRRHTWEIRLDPVGWKATGPPRQVTFGADDEYLASVSAGKLGTVRISQHQSDLYSIPIDSRSGQPTGAARRLTKDGRYKVTVEVGGDPASAYFDVSRRAGYREYFAIDPATARQTPLMHLPSEIDPRFSRDARQVAYNERKGNRYSIRLGDASGDLAAARVLCDGCGRALDFSSDGRFLFYSPEQAPERDHEIKTTIRLMDVATGKDRPWLEHPVDSLTKAAPFGDGRTWVLVEVRQDPKAKSSRFYLVPWREVPAPVSEWLPITIPNESAPLNYGTGSYDLSFFEGDKLMLVRFDPSTKQVSAPVLMKFFDSVVPQRWPPLAHRGGAVVFCKAESRSSVWLMKLPE